jgi:hypothetical protein
MTVELHINVVMRYHSHPTRMTIIKKSDDNNSWWRCKEIGILILY